MKISFKPGGSNTVFPLLNGKRYGTDLFLYSPNAGLDQRGLAAARIIRDCLDDLEDKSVEINWKVGKIIPTGTEKIKCMNYLNYNLNVLRVDTTKLASIKFTRHEQVHV